MPSTPQPEGWAHILDKQISPAEADQWIDDYHAAHKAEGLYAVTYDKTTLLTLLAQPGCDGIRIYLVKRAPGLGKKHETSFVLVGVHDAAPAGQDPQWIEIRPVKGPKGDYTGTGLLWEWGDPYP